MPELPEIKSPADLKALPAEQLSDLAEKIRQTLITTLSQTGGHLGPNLGVVELTHRAAPRLRHAEGQVRLRRRATRATSTRCSPAAGTASTPSGSTRGSTASCLRTESEHDCYGAGHAGTALGAALGMAVGRDLRGSDEHVVCVAGDAAFTCGPTFEALNNVAAHTKRFIVVLNDNEWCIDRNVGAIAQLLQRHRHQPDLRRVCTRRPRTSSRRFVGKGVRRLAGKVEESAKSLLLAAPSQSATERDLRGVRPPLLRADRRARPPAAHQDLRVPQDAERAGAPAHHHREGPRLQTRARRSRQIPRPRQIQHRDRRDRRPPPRRPTPRSSRAASRDFAKEDHEDRRHHRRHARRHRARPSSRRRSRSATSMSASPRSTPRSSPAAWPPRAASRSSRSTPPSCSAPTT